MLHPLPRATATTGTHTKVLESLKRGAVCTACSKGPVVHRSSAICSLDCAADGAYLRAGFGNRQVLRYVKQFRSPSI